MWSRFRQRSHSLAPDFPHLKMNTLDFLEISAVSFYLELIPPRISPKEERDSDGRGELFSSTAVLFLDYLQYPNIVFICKRIL